MAGEAQENVLQEVRDKAEQLESLLDNFSDRLRRMRQRNREVEEEIASFEADLDRLRHEVLDTRAELDE